MPSLNKDLFKELNRNIETAFQEDCVRSDLTSLACLSQKDIGIATLLVKERCTLAGLPFLSLITSAIDPDLEVSLMQAEGSLVSTSTLIAKIKGKMVSLLSVERTLLNFLQHATSIATETARYVKLVEGKCDILDTRKTLPCHRFLQKYAVMIGGGKNHRFHLADQILIKDNHLISVSIKEAITKTKEMYPSKKIQIEVENLKMFNEAIQAKPDAIMLDNMSLEEIREAVSLSSQDSSQIYLEASGNIDLQTIRSYAETGVNGISIGKLTHSITGIDMSIKIRRD